MKLSRVVVIVATVAALTGIGMFALSTAEGSDRLAVAGSEVCWEIDSGEIDIMKVVLLPLGSNHYFMSGQINESPPDPTDIETVFGNAEVVGNEVYMTFCTSGSDDTGAWGWIGRAILNAGTLAGTVELVGIEHDAVAPDTYVAHEGSITMTRVTCP